jgi:hypothetical protein
MFKPAVRIRLVNAARRCQALPQVSAAVSGRTDGPHQLGIQKLILQEQASHRLTLYVSRSPVNWYRDASPVP